jgi:hypothetical protein
MVPTEVFVRPLLLGEVHILIHLLGPGLLSSLVSGMNRELTEKSNFFVCFATKNKMEFNDPYGGGGGGHKISNKDRKDKRISKSMIYLTRLTCSMLRI